jgi:hypothetical protein
MTTNNTGNSDRTRSQTTQDPNTWASPVDKAEGAVHFGQSDIHPERKQRLKDYLSGTTRGDSSNLDVTQIEKPNDYTVSPEDTESSDTFGRDVSQALSDAYQAFTSNSEGSSFNNVNKPQKTKGVHTPGDHTSLFVETVEAVKNAIQDAPKKRTSQPKSVSSAGRWGRIRNAGDRAFKNKTRVQQANEGHLAYKNPVEKFDERLENEDEAKWWRRDKKKYTSKLKDKLRDDAEYWADFFEVASEYGYMEIGKYRDSFNTLISIDPDNLELPSDSAFMHEDDHEKKTYTMRYDPESPYFAPNADDIGTSLLMALDILKVFFFSVIGANIANLLQVLSAGLSELDKAGELSLQNLFDPLDVLAGKGPVSDWENVYIDTPMFSDPTKLYKGSSGYNQDPLREKLLESEELEYRNIKESMQSIGQEISDLDFSSVGDADSFAEGYSRISDSASGLLESIKSSTKNLTFVENLRVQNASAHLLRDLNVVVPKATLSNLRNSNSGILKQASDIVLAYNLAAVNGLIHIFYHAVVHGALDPRNGPFFKNMVHNVYKHRAFWRNYVRNEVTQREKFMHFVGEGNKLISFYNYCVRIGDILVQADPSSKTSISENKVPLDDMQDHPSLRLAKYRRYASKESTFSMASLPSLYLLPEHHRRLANSASHLGNSSMVKESEFGHSSKFKRPNSTGDQPAGHRFTPEQVRAIEDQLEAELLPLSIQDLRTNEVISFHAFLTEISDTYSASWSAQQGFGRLEAAQIYGGGSRSIGIGFEIVAFNENDFDEMWYKINKLTTLVYPQWSRGTKMKYDDNSTFIQPFSQVPTASPLARLRLGDIFTSNYSKQNLARLMGMGNFTGEGQTIVNRLTGTADISEDRYLNNRGLKKYAKLARDLNAEVSITSDIRAVWQPSNVEAQILSSVGNIVVKINDEDVVLSSNVTKEEFILSTRQKLLSQEGSSIQDFMSSVNNPIVKAFESTMGRGIAVAINSITFNWGWGENSWNTDPGSRAPRKCQVSLGIIPIHDITPGLDHEGYNRAPIYGVGSYMNNLKGDPHLTVDDYNELLRQINSDVEDVLYQGAIRTPEAIEDPSTDGNVRNEDLGGASLLTPPSSGLGNSASSLSGGGEAGSIDGGIVDLNATFGQ